MVLIIPGALGCMVYNIRFHFVFMRGSSIPAVSAMVLLVPDLCSVHSATRSELGGIHNSGKASESPCNTTIYPLLDHCGSTSGSLSY